MANYEINEEQEVLTKAMRMIETGDPVHADVYNALFSALLNNDVFLEKLANKMVQQAMVSHVMDSTNSNMVLGADQGPVITKLIDKVQEQVTVLNTKTSKTGHIHDDRYYTEAEIEAKFNQRMLIPSPISSSGGISTYQIKPQIADQGIFCFCRSELYIVRLGQSGGEFNAYDLIQISDHTATTNASVSMTADKKALIFKCAQFENPIFIGRF